MSSNYSLTCLTNSFEIIAVPVTVIADANQTKVYGDTDPVYTYHYTGNILSGDDFYGELSRIEGEDVGIYAIQQGTLSLGSNYEIIFNSDNFEITLKPVVVTADPDQSKIFGQDDPVFTYSVSPDLVYGDNFTGALTREQGEDVGLYEILQGDLALNSNYELSFVGADFEIEEIPITVIVDPNQSKIYGEADPEFTYTYTGTLEPGDIV